MKKTLLWLGTLALLLSACGTNADAPPSASAPPSSAVEEDSVIDETPPSAEETEAPAPEEAETNEPADTDFVRVQDYLPDVAVDLKYAAQDNFTGQVIYSFTDAYLRYGTVKKLEAVYDELSADGYSLKIWDAFRPTWAQFKLWDVCPDPAYVSNPTKGFSSHSRGNTVDLTLIAADGTDVEMPTGFDDFTARADRDYSDVTETAAANARYLEDVMQRNGFKPYSQEWWHYSDTDSYEVEQTFSPPEGH
mgnify:FL=1